MSDNTECQCPPKPHYSLGSMASGSNHERDIQQRWEAEHGSHANATWARVETTNLSLVAVQCFRRELQRDVERYGPTRPVEISPGHLKALLDAAEMALKK